MLATKDLYMKACLQSKELHVMTDEERLKLQAHLRGMYLEIEKVCDRHGLRMCAGYGTVLGALRHGGFIPWDDDMDLLMPREDYDKLINKYADELPSRYKIYAPNSKNGPIYRFAKVVDTKTRFLGIGAEDSDSHGIFVDIFPLENAAKTYYSFGWFRIKACFLMYIPTSVVQYKCRGGAYKYLMCSSKVGMFNYYFRSFIGFLFSWRTKEQWFNSFDKTMSQRAYSGYYNIPSDGPRMLDIGSRHKSIYFPAKKMKFDDIEVYVPNQYERYCELEYGDWTWIPPVEQRWQHFIKEIRF